jgi:secreted trypsin-like serine protease
MRRLLALLMLAGWLLPASAALGIAHGEDADAARSPWMVSLTSDRDERQPVAGRCGGSLIAPRFVLTAAHCLEGLAGDALVVAGRQGVGRPAERSARIARVFRHPGYRLEFPFERDDLQQATATHDIGLIRLATPIAGATLRLARRSERRLVRPGRGARLWGYGPIFSTPGACSSPPGAVPPCFAPGTLHRADVHLLSRRRCGRSYPRALDGTMLCAADLDGSRRAHSCPGDSGSPLAVRAGGRWVQVGVVSWGAEVKQRACDATRLPMVMARVPALRGWVNRTMRRAPG